MTVRSMGCAACGADVPHGRLSCPACGELLASVSGGVRQMTAEAPTSRPLPSVLHDGPDRGTDAPADPPPAAASLAEPPAAPPLPGAYLPPATLATPGGIVMAAGPAAPARAWAGTNAAVEPGADASDASATSAAADALRARARESIGWIAVAGCAVSGLGFLVPWARTMIGSGGDGYIDQWGLAGPGHLLVILALAVIGALTVLTERVPAWLRLGLPGLALGSLIVGLVWPYLFGPLGTLPGAYLSLVGALMLAGAAVATLVIDRHASGGSPV
jgi:hypothetical protein